MLLRKFRNFIRDNGLFNPGEPVLLAVSGGIDSTVMAHLYAEAGYKFGIAHCNFNLRGQESDMDVTFVKTLSEKFGVPFYSINFDTKEYASNHGISIQMAARELRYTWFEDIRQNNNYQYIATAHHLDDQAETILINLVRGTGIAGLHGIPVKKNRLIRPLMFARRSELAKYAQQHVIAFREDQSNHEVKYLRNKIRHEIIPLLASVNPEFIENLTSSVRKITDYENIASDTLTEWKDKITQSREDETIVDTAKLKSSGYPEALAWFTLSPFGFNESQVSDILRSMDDSEEKTFVTRNHSLYKERDRLVIRKNRPDPEMEQRIEVGPEVSEISVPLNLKFKIVNSPANYEIPAENSIASLDFNKLTFPLVIRKWQPGDAFQPFGMKGKKKISDFFTDMKFSQKQKDNTWLLCSGNNIVWIIGYRIGHRFRITANTSRILQIILANFAHY